MFSFFSSPFGVDIGSRTLKVIQTRGRTVSVAAVMDTGLPDEEERHYAERMEQFFTSLNLRDKPAVVNVPGSHAFIRTVNFPLMPHGELVEALRWEVKRQLPYPVEDAVFDYVATDTSENIAVTYAACEKQYIQDHIAPLKAAGLNIAAIDINPLSLLRTIKPGSAGNVVILDIGGANTEIHIVKNMVLRITRTVEVGAETLKRQLMAGGMDEAEAERLMRTGTLDELGGLLAEISTELFRSIDYYKATFKEKAVNEIMLTGGLTLNPEVKRHFEEAFGLPVSVPDPFEGMELSDESMRALGPVFSVAVGLTRRKA